MLEIGYIADLFALQMGLETQKDVLTGKMPTKNKKGLDSNSPTPSLQAGGKDEPHDCIVAHSTQRSSKGCQHIVRMPIVVSVLDVSHPSSFLTRQGENNTPFRGTTRCTITCILLTSMQPLFHEQMVPKHGKTENRPQKLRHRNFKEVRQSPPRTTTTKEK